MALPAQDEDLANGTPTLQLAHALEACRPERRGELLHLREAARGDLLARARLREVLAEAEIATGYASRIEAVQQHACALLDHLATPSPHRDLLHALLHTAAAQANPTTQRAPR